MKTIRQAPIVQMLILFVGIVADRSAPIEHLKGPIYKIHG